MILKIVYKCHCCPKYLLLPSYARTRHCGSIPESHRLTRRRAVPQNTLQAAQTKAKSIRSRRLGLVHEIHYQHAEPA